MDDGARELSNHIIFAVADGLGHGVEAAEASRAFCDFISKSVDEDIPELFGRASKAISSTRGAAAAIVRIDRETGILSFVGIGNIELQALSRKPIRPVCTPGIVGRPLRTVKQYDYSISSGDVIVLYSDGISSRLTLSNYRNLTPQEMADAILKDHGKYHDDATVLVVKIV